MMYNRTCGQLNNVVKMVFKNSYVIKQKNPRHEKKLFSWYYVRKQKYWSWNEEEERINKNNMK